MDFNYGQQKSLFTNGSSQSSSGWQFAGDYRRSSYQFVGNTSQLTVAVSDDDGFLTPITNISILSGVVLAGVYSVATTYRWIHFFRMESTVTVTYQGAAF